MHLLQSNHFSGAENVVCQIIEAFKSNPEYDMVYCCHEGDIEKTLKQMDINYYLLKSFSKKEIKKAINVIKPDIIHAHDRSASLMAAVASKRIPIVVHMHVNNNKGFKMFIRNAVWTLFSYRYNHIFWVSKSSFDNFQFHKHLSKKSSILYNVLPIDKILFKCNLDANDYSYDVIYCGRLTYQKNPERLMEICNLLIRKKPTAKVAIVGSGEYDNFIKQYLDNNSLKNNVDFLGFIDNPLKIIKDSKALLLCSRFEGTPMVAIESQILGTPIVSTPVDGVKELIKDGYNGFLNDSNDDIVNSLLKLIDEKVDLSQNCLLFSKEFCDYSNYKMNIASVYNAVFIPKAPK